MPILSEEQLIDLSEAYSCDQLIDILGIESIQLLMAFREDVEENISKFNLRPVDCHDFQI
jgi:hypothetical protein|tara:strand:- start:7771 stop:7950 length:180 start_codon:yes stop_codon:yes gene_type:complete